ncbi:MAG: phytoene desaturase family protein [Bacteroidota bacterium]
MSKKISIIGSGFAGLSAASCLADQGFDVQVFEKNSLPGGRARYFEAEGFRFDMGPSWYWMPDVFERYFKQFGHSPRDFYELVRLNPSYRVWYGDKEVMDIPAEMEGVYELFESVEKGAADQLKRFMKEAAYKYQVGINDLVYKSGRSVWEFADIRVLKGVFRLHLFRSFSRYVRKYFRHPYLISLLEFPVLFLGAKPQQTPALYSLMNYADMQLGTWYPMGGMHKVVEGMVQVAEKLGVRFHFDSEVEAINIWKDRANEILVNGQAIPSDIVVGGADYHHIEQRLLPEAHRQYSPKYWETRTMAPSCLLFFVGVNRPVRNLLHHNLFFDESFDRHAEQIYDDPQWPNKPLFYVCAPSKTDPSVAPEGQENLFLLVPVAPGLDDTEEQRELQWNRIMDRLEALTGESIRPHIIYKRSYAHRDFISDYHAFRGNAYGLANTLRQTALLKPKMQSKKVKNLFYTGQLTVPGPGVPPALISGRVVADVIGKEFKRS